MLTAAGAGAWSLDARITGRFTDAADVRPMRRTA
jgi:hypothetical protein